MKPYSCARNRLYTLIFMGCVAAFWTVAHKNAVAQTQLSSDAPIEVSADKELEWDRVGKTYIARGSAKAAQGSGSLEGDVLKAYYRDQKNKAATAGTTGNTKIDKIEAFGHVIIKSDGNTAMGDKGIYDLISGQAVLTGNNLMLVTPRETITARDQITFNSSTNIMTADGDAKVEQGSDVLESDKVIARFKIVNGQRVLNDMDAIGNVVITTPDEVLIGDKGHYDASTDIATVTGNVRIERGPNVLTGTRAQTNLTTRKSKVFSETPAAHNEEQPAKKKRVRAIFYPKK